jgi:hypothetical protein
MRGVENIKFCFLFVSGKFPRLWPSANIGKVVYKMDCAPQGHFTSLMSEI